MDRLIGLAAALERAALPIGDDDASRLEAISERFREIRAQLLEFDCRVWADSEGSVRVAINLPAGTQSALSSCARGDWLHIDTEPKSGTGPLSK